MNITATLIIYHAILVGKTKLFTWAGRQHATTDTANA
jgi:hypothetical protein